MKKIGSEVLFLPTSNYNPRNGEGAMIRLHDGRIMYAYTKHCGDGWGDHATANVAAYYSSDEGKTWVDGGVLVNKDNDALNIMSVSLLRMQNGDLGIVYLRKSMKDGNLLCMPYIRRSSDEGKTFGAPVLCVAEEGYYVLNNDRVVRLDCGRLIIPTAYHGKSGIGSAAGVLETFYSDDDGLSWTASDNAVHSPYSDCTQLQEPGVFEMPDGRIWMWCRTAYGHQYQCFSTDKGKTWSGVEPSFKFTSPDSPMQVKRVGKYAVAIFNPIGFDCTNTKTEVWGSPKRTPLVCSFDLEGGRSFVENSRTPANGGFDDFIANTRLLEDDRTNSYCYPAVLELSDGFLVAYYHSNNTDVCLNSTKITKVLFDELDV